MDTIWTREHDSSLEETLDKEREKIEGMFQIQRKSWHLIGNNLDKEVKMLAFIHEEEVPSETFVIHFSLWETSLRWKPYFLIWSMVDVMTTLDDSICGDFMCVWVCLVCTL